LSITCWQALHHAHNQHHHRYFASSHHHTFLLFTLHSRTSDSNRHPLASGTRSQLLRWEASIWSLPKPLENVTSSLMSGRHATTGQSRRVGLKSRIKGLSDVFLVKALRVTYASLLDIGNFRAPAQVQRTAQQYETGQAIIHHSRRTNTCYNES
jgi:hypothetical protein